MSVSDGAHTANITLLAQYDARRQAWDADHLGEPQMKYMGLDYSSVSGFTGGDKLDLIDIGCANR